MLIWEESFVYVFLGMLTYIWMPARPTREIKKMIQWMLSVLLWKIRAEAAEMTLWAVPRAAVSHHRLEQHPVQPLISYSTLPFPSLGMGGSRDILGMLCLGGSAVCL